jgi:hypothetical protein
MNVTSPATSEPQAGLEGIVEDASQLQPEETDAEKEIKRRELASVKKTVAEYEQAREFDKYARRQYAIDRRYAAGTADKNWVVSTNLIGSFIDILTSFLYARNPDVSVKKAPQVDDTGTAQLEDFAKTVEIVVSKLWKQGRLKDSARRMVRSALSTGVGWLKVVLICEGTNIPQMEADLNDARDNLQKLEALQAELQGAMQGADALVDENGQPIPAPTVKDSEGKDLSPDELDAKTNEAQELMESLSHQVEVAIRKYLAIDFVSSESIQVSLDVRYLSDYRNANWVSNDIYRPKDEAKAMFPRLKDEDLATAKAYYQKRSASTTAIDPNALFLEGQSGGPTADDADQFTAGMDTNSNSNGEPGLAFVKIIERWDHQTNHIYTWIDGVKRWAVEPYQPDYPSARFYPYFMVAFYEVDGERHPQSLSWRLHKLQDEYSASRSGFRLMRQRAAPGILFNANGMSDDDVKKITDGTEQEYIPLKPTNPDTPIQNLFAEKPIAKIDPRMYDNTAILSDMEKVAGVQEALQSSTSPEKTATEAEIQQTGFASRTTADRDCLEEVLSEMATYTAQLAIGGIPTKDVQRMAGPKALWPEGMALEDLLTMVELEITAGTTGKPKSIGDRDAWGVLLPQIKECIMQMQQAIMTGNVPLANSLKELLRETMLRMGDDTDIDRFVPQIPEMPAMGPGAVDPVTGLPVQPGAPGGLPPGGPPADLPPGGLPPDQGPSPLDGGAPPLPVPDIQVPPLNNPVN